jgi:hypothetical protein
MAVSKAIRSNSSAQHQPHHAKSARAGGPKLTRRRPNPQTQGLQSNALRPQDPQPAYRQPADPQLKSELFEAIRHLNRGFGVALSSFDRLQRKDRLHQPPIFPRDFLLAYRNRTEALRSVANRDLLRFLAGREEQEASRFSRLCGEPTAASNRKRRP